MEPIDLRSDTVTRPDDAMRAAMATAEVGDDVFGEDPTVRTLEEEAADRLGMEAGLFVPSGTMGNQIAIHLHTRRGDEILCDAQSHIIIYEMGGLAAISGVQARPLPSSDGLLVPAEVEAAIVQGVPYQSRTTAIVVENSHNLAGGTVYPVERLRELTKLASSRSLKIHLDGARVFNAAVALDREVADLTAGFDSVSFCLSKGLGAPVGSILCGRTDWILEARRVRKMLGGGMRQVGVLAAAGRLALRDGPARLAEDHRNARLLAAGLAELDGIEVEDDGVRSNIVICRLRGNDAPGLTRALAERGVLAIPLFGDKLRFVTHRDVSRDQILLAIEAAREAVYSSQTPM